MEIYNLNIDSVTAEIKELLTCDTKQVAETFRLIELGINDSDEILKKGTAANKNVVYNHRQEIKAIVDGHIPNSASIAMYSARLITSLLKKNSNISKETLDMLRSKIIIHPTQLVQ